MEPGANAARPFNVKPFTCVTVAVAGTALALAGCGSDATGHQFKVNSIEDDDAGQILKADGIEVLVAERPDSGMEALGGGTLETVGGCLGASGTVIVWPHGTEITSDSPLTISIPDRGTYRIGDDIEIGGGYVIEHSTNSPADTDPKVGGLTVPATCVRHDVFLAH